MDERRCGLWWQVLEEDAEGGAEAASVVELREQGWIFEFFAWVVEEFEGGRKGGREGVGAGAEAEAERV